jgi:hypothetical protein
MCGSSGAQKNISAGQQNFFNSLQQNYASEFAGQQSILNSLNAAFQPILAGGPNAQGFSPAESAALNTQAMNTTGANYANAARATNEQMAGRGGGNAYLPSGVNAQISGTIASQAAGQLSAEQNQNLLQNYGQGRQNFFNAAGALSGAASLYNPSGFAGQTTGAGNAAFGSATQMYNQGNQWVGALSGALGGAVSAVSGGLTGGLGTEMSKVGSGNFGW